MKNMDNNKLISLNQNILESLHDDELEPLLLAILTEDELFLRKYFVPEKDISSSEMATDYLLSLPSNSFENRNQLFGFIFNNEYYVNQNSLIISRILFCCRSGKRALSSPFIFTKITSKQTINSLRIKLANSFLTLNENKLAELQLLNDETKNEILPIYISEISKKSVHEIMNFVINIKVPSDNLVNELKDYFETSFYSLFASLDQRGDSIVSYRLRVKFKESIVLETLDYILSLEEFSMLKSRIQIIEMLENKHAYSKSSFSSDNSLNAAVSYINESVNADEISDYMLSIAVYIGQNHPEYLTKFKLELLNILTEEINAKDSGVSNENIADAFKNDLESLKNSRVAKIFTYNPN